MRLPIRFRVGGRQHSMCVFSVVSFSGAASRLRMSRRLTKRRLFSGVTNPFFVLRIDTLRESFPAPTS